MERLLKEVEVAALLGLKVKTIQRWRFEGRGPEFRKLGGGAVRYSAEALAEWVRAQPAGGDAVERK